MVILSSTLFILIKLAIQPNATVSLLGLLSADAAIALLNPEPVGLPDSCTLSASVQL